MKIRPFVEINQSSNSEGGIVLQQSDMRGLLIGPARQSENYYEPQLVMGTVSSIIDQARLAPTLIDVAGIIEGADLLPETIRFGVENGTAELQIASPLAGKIKSVEEAHIIVIDTTVEGSASYADIVSAGAKVGDFLEVSYDNAGIIETFQSKIRTITEEAGIIEVTLWNAVSIGDDATEFSITILKNIAQAPLGTSSALTATPLLNKVTFDGTSSPDDAFFTAELYVYSPLADITHETTKVSTTRITNLSDYTESVTVLKVVSGNVYNLFDATRTDLSDNILDVDFNYEQVIGSGEDKANKVAYAMKLICKEVPGAQMRVYVTKDDSPESYAKALGFVQSTSLAYSVSVLTDDPSVINAVEAMVNAAADPFLAKYKMGFVSPKTPHFNRKMIVADYSIQDKGDGTFEVVANGGGFLAHDIQVGSTVYTETDLAQADEDYLDADGDTYQSSWAAKIETVVTDDKIIITPAIPGTDLVATTSGENLILGGLSEGVILSELVKKNAMDMNNKRMVSIFPDKYSIEVDNYEQEIIPGYFVAALLNGVVAHLPPQQGISNLSLPSLKRAIGSSFVFTDAALDDIASAGILTIIQESMSSDPYILRQLTTDVSALDTMEISKVRCLDKATEVFSAHLTEYIGKRNITEANVDDIRRELRDAGISLTGNPIPLLGAVITSYEIVSVLVPADEADAVNAIVDVTTPTSLNKIRLNIQSK